MTLFLFLMFLASSVASILNEGNQNLYRMYNCHGVFFALLLHTIWGKYCLKMHNLF